MPGDSSHRLKPASIYREGVPNDPTAHTVLGQLGAPCDKPHNMALCLRRRPTFPEVAVAARSRAATRSTCASANHICGLSNIPPSPTPSACINVMFATRMYPTMARNMSDLMVKRGPARVSSRLRAIGRRGGRLSPLLSCAGGLCRRLASRSGRKRPIAHGPCADPAEASPAALSGSAAAGIWRTLWGAALMRRPMRLVSPPPPWSATRGGS